MTGQPSKSKLESYASKKTSTAKELQMFFKKGEEDIKSKYSTISKNSKISFKDKLYNQLDRKRNESVNSQPEKEEEAPKEDQVDALFCD